MTPRLFFFVALLINSTDRPLKEITFIFFAFEFFITGDILRDASTMESISNPYSLLENGRGDSEF